jgi:hypothetical protein
MTASSEDGDYPAAVNLISVDVSRYDRGVRSPLKDGISWL